MDIVLIGRLETKTLGAAYNLQEERLEIGWMLAKGYTVSLWKINLQKALTFKYIFSTIQAIIGNSFQVHIQDH